MADRTGAWYASQTNAHGHGQGYANANANTGNMRPDEQYPIPVFSNPDETLPEVAPPAHLEYFAPDSGTEASAPGANGYSYSPMTGVSPMGDASPDVHHEGGGKEAVYTEATPAGLGAGAGAEASDVAAERDPSRICGIRKRTLWIILAVACVVVIAAVVGGVVGGLKSNSSSTSSSSSATATTTASGSTTSTAAATTLAASDRPLAVSNTAGTGSNDATLQIFYQNLTSTDILYRLMWSGDVSSEGSLSFNKTPISGTPLTVSAYNASSNNIAINLFYLTKNKTSDTSIAHARLTCARYASACSTDKNVIISSNFTRTIANHNGLASIDVDQDGAKLRVWVQASGKVIWELTNNDTSLNTWTQHNLGVSAVLGTGLAAMEGPNSTELVVNFAANSNGLPTALEYSDANTASAGSGAALVSSTPTGWYNTTFVSSCYDVGANTYHLYYKGGQGALNALWRTGESGSWTYNRETSWGSPQGGLASTCWSLNTRLIYFTNDRLIMNAMTNGSWAALAYLT